MKRKIIVMFLMLFVIIGITGCSKFAKYKPGVTYKNLVEPSGISGIVYGAVYLSGNRLKLRDVQLRSLDTGKVYGIDYVVRKTAKNIGQSYYIANIPPGRYIFYKMIASGEKRKSYNSTSLNYSYGVFKDGTGKEFSVKKNQATYIGNYFFAKTSALNTLRNLVSDKQIYNAINSHKKTEVLIADIYANDKHREFMKFWMIKKLADEKPGTAWLPILEKSVVGYNKLNKAVGDSFLKLLSMANSFELASQEKKDKREKIVLADNKDFKVAYDKKNPDLEDLPFSDAAAKKIIAWIQGSKKLSSAQMVKLVKLVKKAFTKGEFQMITLGNNHFYGKPMKMFRKMSIAGDVFIGRKRKGYFMLGLDSKGNPTEKAY